MPLRQSPRPRTPHQQLLDLPRLRAAALGAGEGAEGGTMGRLEDAEHYRFLLIGKRDKEANLGRHKRRVVIEKELRLQTCEVLRLWIKERAGD